MRHGVEQARGERGSHAGHQLHDPKASHAAARVLRKAQDRQQVLDVRRFQKLQTAKFHKGNLTPHQFKLQRRAVRGRSEQYRLRLQTQPRFALLQNPVGNPARLLGFVAHHDQLCLRTAGLVGPETLGVALGRELDDGVRDIQNRLR